MYYLLPNEKEFTPSKKLKVTTEIEEFNFKKIKRTKIKQMKQPEKLAIEQSENIKYLAEAIKIYQKLNNTLHLENTELKRKFEEYREHDYLTRLKQITIWRNQAVAEFIILEQEYPEKFLINYIKNTLVTLEIIHPEK
ncbi:17392_t:CDS:2 [Racocetra persica]|uniref:17392_t:CDS:1 n=1 Tax=Racocetra persica TaxID=160502 RepID=A0ACA9MLX6_9GLOM|nr:17392_t:CDS:2 [Racocetra persica]